MEVCFCFFVFFQWDLVMRGGGSEGLFCCFQVLFKSGGGLEVCFLCFVSFPWDLLMRGVAWKVVLLFPVFSMRGWFGSLCVFFAHGIF